MVKIICAGYPKTGTKSLHDALDTLGCDKSELIIYLLLAAAAFVPVTARNQTRTRFRRVWRKMEGLNVKINYELDQNQLFKS